MQNLPRTPLGSVRTNLAAGCHTCKWFDYDEGTIALAKAGQLLCGGCFQRACLYYLRPDSVEACLSAGVHEEVASSSEKPPVGGIDRSPQPWWNDHEPLAYRVMQGRPRIEDKDKSFEATKPWLALGMSRRTWYSRRKEAGDAEWERLGRYAAVRKEKEQGK